MSRAFGPEYARGNEAAAQLLSPAYRRPEGRRAALEAASTRPLHPTVRDELLRQNQELPETTARSAALQALGTQQPLFVVTGQQVGLFAGPLYSFWKAATAVILARRLQEESARPVLPIFWLQTEDHDLPEIATATLGDAHGALHRLGCGAPGPARASIAHQCLDQEVDEALERAAAFLGPLPHGAAALKQLGEAYRRGRPWHEAFRDLVADVFADTPLLFLQPRTPGLAPLVAQIHARAVHEHAEIVRLLETRAQTLESAGFKVQVPVRADAPLSFVHHPHVGGERYRLRQGAQGWVLADGSKTETPVDVESLLRDEPLRWSTSALLRPMVQDTLLPTVAVVGGPGELAYFAQLPPLYEHFGLPLPLVIPRASGTWIDPESQESLDELGLQVATLKDDVDALLEQLGPPAGAPDFSAVAASLREAAAAVLDPVLEQAGALDAQLEMPIRKTLDSIQRDAERLQRRLELSSLRADPVRVARVRKLLARLRPGGVPQDRSLCWADLAARVGPENIGSLLMDALERHDGFDFNSPIEIRL